ncbi:hypothetical protein M407DRAFT_243321 [Tulasnella calospora MUT 4182]|uniref:Uncharacterized protein n=1 Tax=Tulasnella calospora MUT 4182 TaxID=1051891 RepID=A0A0C3QLG0_9AGAM|nr:hypothetical protein M407DRAFT_243321 [Tulasnella calospora MUT 4182]
MRARVWAVTSLARWRPLTSVGSIVRVAQGQTFSMCRMCGKRGLTSRKISLSDSLGSLNVHWSLPTPASTEADRQLGLPDRPPDLTNDVGFDFHPPPDFCRNIFIGHSLGSRVWRFEEGNSKEDDRRSPFSLKGPASSSTRGSPGPRKV